ncbi:phytase [Phenylobacterium deserti]|uniref:3-phytase n=1 Tax=Phenylobacterium deserti TaxID=1914756 RepID=A0A328A9R9_9CAUL|nr:phytase [Phenylobacterium deserti]RAK51279.1 3-phytase [Phenylobacterium deserti]
MFSCRFHYSFVTVSAASLLLASCAVFDPELRSDSRGMTVGAGTPVPVAAETPTLGVRGEDSADDPEIWVDARDPSRGVILGTDKQSGLYVYDLAGRQLNYLPGGKPNNVDLREGFPTPAGERVLVAASDRGRNGAALFLLDPASLKVTFWATIPVDLVEPYGLCTARVGEAFYVIVNGTDGQVRQLRVSAGADNKPRWVEERRFGLATQTEGCVADEAKGALYIGEENRGIWRFPLTGPAGAGELIAQAPSDMLQPDVEGLTILRDGQASWLIASSQGDSAFAVWRIDGDAPVYRGRFSGVAANGVDGVTGTDGVAAHGGVVGAFPEGLVVAQDDEDQGADQPGRQNFKLIDWREVKRALGL